MEILSNRDLEIKTEELFLSYLRELKQIQQEHNLKNSDISEMLGIDQKYVDKLLAGDKELFTPLIWIRSITCLDIDARVHACGKSRQGFDVRANVPRPACVQNAKHRDQNALAF